MQEFLAVLVSSEVHSLPRIKCRAHSIYTYTQFLLHNKISHHFYRGDVHSLAKCLPKIEWIGKLHWLHLFPMTTLNPNQVNNIILSIYYGQVTSWLQTRSPISTARCYTGVQDPVCINDIQCSSKTEMSMKTEGISHNTKIVTTL